jgi:hypothetical protein
MRAKREWVKSSTGPDWIDVEMMLRALGALHSASVGITLLPRGIGATGGLSVGANCMFDVLPGSALPPSVSVTKDWPCSQHKDLASHCFALLHELDFQISKVYKNEALWE